MEAPAKPLIPPQSAPLIDPFGRAISYVRVSVTDRCDFRCVYCMSEHMAFLPRRDLLTLEELDRLIAAFVSRGTKKLRITGGEPLVRHDVMRLFKALSRHLDTGGLEELTLTTNGSQLSRFADHLFDCGVNRVNVSLDTLNPELFRQITRTGSHEQVMAGLDAARMAGLKVKINVVALKGVNENEFISLVQFAHDRGFDITFIEVMPLGSSMDLNGLINIYQCNSFGKNYQQNLRSRTLIIALPDRRVMCGLLKQAAVLDLSRL